ncbi:TIGR03086 family metal-binding protein [Amycolatopsis nigrescens]|uniref:TIGR03086 family metal-binding protein n=1 Tax=Amycolatopsis nigrescens TaxID=381445 RepID=UPI00036F0C13|nr:TIGR03086 family metal-binding protein [Amycolatopsis nigrescens]
MIDLKPACHRMITLLDRIADDQLTSPTPCAEYDVGDLIGHLDEVSLGFTAVARKEVGEPAVVGLGDGRRERLAGQLRVLGEAWDDPAAWTGRATVIGLELANELWGKIAFTEVVVHGWDLAKATGLPFELPGETLRACFDHVAAFVPSAPVEGLWGTAVEVPADAPLLDRIVAITGRTP